MTTPDLQALIELSEKATAGPWCWSENGNIIPVEYQSDSEIAAVYTERHDEMAPANAEFIIALVNWFRANHSTLTAKMVSECSHCDGAGGFRRAVCCGNGTPKYARHEKPGKPASIKVTYQCGMRRFNELVCLEHRGFALAKAVEWWRVRAGSSDVPASVNDALELAYQLPSPVSVEVDETDKYPSILAHTFAEAAVQIEAKPIKTNLDRAPSWMRDALKEAA